MATKAPRTDAVDILVPAARRRQSTGFVRVHRSTQMPEQFCASGLIRFTMAARAVADAARGLTELREVRAVVADSVQRGWCRAASTTRARACGSSSSSSWTARAST